MTAGETGLLFKAALSLAKSWAQAGASLYATVPSGPLLVHFVQAFTAAGFTFRAQLTWVKQQFVIGMADYHHRYEPILYGWLPGAAHYFANDRSQDDVFEVDKPHSSDLHPTTKPVELVARMVRNSSREDELVYDPFCGSGSTLLAAHQLGRIGYGVEIDPGYVCHPRTPFDARAQTGADKPMMKRNPDGTWRNARHAIVVSNRITVARWVTAEILRCKLTGLSMAAIAVHIGRVGQALEQPLSPFPEGIEFPADYRISESAVFKAYHKAMDRQPTIDAELFRKEDTARCEDMYMKLQRGISNGDPRHIDAAVRVLNLKAKLNGYTLEPEQSSGLTSFNITINLGQKKN